MKETIVAYLTVDERIVCPLCAPECEIEIPCHVGSSLYPLKIEDLQGDENYCSHCGASLR